MINIYYYKNTPDNILYSRAVQKNDISSTVAAIITDVAGRGDAALLEFTEKFDGVKLKTLEVSNQERRIADEITGGEFIGVLRRAAANITEYHKNQLREGFEIKKDNGVVLGQKITPIENVGIYVPGGTAPLASTVLMNAIPAKLAGCRNIVMCTPPGRDGGVDPAVIAAANVAGVSRIFKVGGAQAVAAMAYGTATIPQLDKIVGPGNAYVTEAKRQVFGRVAIDMIAGPSEILIIADDTCNPAHVAADMLSQAEHDTLACAYLVTTSPRLAAAVAKELEKQLKTLPRCNIARESINDNSKIIITENIEQAIAIANKIAPEHLEICIEAPFSLLPRIVNAGSIFLGKSCPEPLGDYYAGPNHTLPTSGSARFSSPLSVDDFIKKSSYTYYPEAALAAAAPDIIAMANREGLTAHARSVKIRLNQ